MFLKLSDEVVYNLSVSIPYRIIVWIMPIGYLSLTVLQCSAIRTVPGTVPYGFFAGIQIVPTSKFQANTRKR